MSRAGDYVRRKNAHSKPVEDKTMSKAECFIREHTNKDSNHVSIALYTTRFTYWLGIDDAKELVKIAREEVIEEACKWLSRRIQLSSSAHVVLINLVEDFRKAMKE